jgi:hypothetical protein
VKPTFCEVTNNTEHNFTARIRFDSEKLRSYLADTDDDFLWVDDVDGNRIPIRVGSLRDALAEEEV